MITKDPPDLTAPRRVTLELPARTFQTLCRIKAEMEAGSYAEVIRALLREHEERRGQTSGGAHT